MSENIKKDRVVSFRLSESEFAPFEKKLAASEMKKSEFFR
ncbi:molybdopterin-guanine dinucleotide biosynthesis protein MobC, partial [Salmonella enterica]|nr:molybdopterin-guanine dinucleotide biosynthesis protein MobC [Salmonella enterica]EBK6410930.1 molybdopterin-guanine dinucleotide biosynthesis protein MobC [Salmonella enterica subsp. enterica serovar Meleagridis]ECH1771226.1 molybdopterin-guanine dinucleotide biosynthesis protein MobC [Salmonella enterica]ECS5343652.1 molybdopterin-guanine dinucleotide biosynthesis protein MobC [Salmonella enterica subsp. enterica serovar Eko]